MSSQENDYNDFSIKLNTETNDDKFRETAEFKCPTSLRNIQSKSSSIKKS